MTDDSLSQIKTDAARLERFTDSLQGTQEASKALDEMLKANQVAASQDKLQSEVEDNSAMRIQVKTLKAAANKKNEKVEKAKQAQESVLIRKEDADALADGFSQRQGNRDYRIDSQLLSQLAQNIGIGIHENLNPDEMISLIRRHMTVDGQTPDVAILDKTFEFLIEVMRVQLATAEGPAKDRLGNIYHKIEAAKFKHFEAHAVEIQVAQKIIGAVNAVVETTGQTVKETLGHYREVVHNPPDLQAMRKFYESKGYKAMVLELKGLNSYLGGNFKRSNLESPELAQLANAARKMQALLGVFRQSKVHIPTMESFLELNGVLAA